MFGGAFFGRVDLIPKALPIGAIWYLEERRRNLLVIYKNDFRDVVGKGRTFSKKKDKKVHFMYFYSL